jgi:hypothetical protein
MTETNRIRSALQGGLQALAELDGAIRRASDHAGESASRMNVSGFWGVAAHVSLVVERLAAAATLIPTIAGQHGQAAAALAQVEAASTPADVVSHLSSVQANIAGSRESLLQLATGTEEAKATALVALQGGAPEELAMMINMAHERAVHVYEALGMADQATVTQINEARQAGK